MTAKRLLGLALLFCFCSQSLAQMQTLSGFRHNGPGRILDSNATFALGMTRDGSTFIGAASLTDTVQIRGEVRPEPTHVGQTADIFVVDRLLGTNEFRMRTQDGVWVPWNATVSTLVPFREDVTLTSAVSVDMFSGTLGNTGDHRIFLGYLPPDGVLRYHTSGLAISITAQGQSARDQAYSLFTSSISPNIVGSRCIMCHVSGGAAQAGGAYHIFRQPLTSNIDANFEIFQGLLALRGVTHVLAKVAGGNNHGGGVQLTGGSADYQAFANFLNLLAEDLPPTDTTTPPDYNPYGY